MRDIAKLTPPQPPAGWKLLPSTVTHKGRVSTVWPLNGRAYVKGSAICVFLKVDEADRLLGTVSHVSDTLGESESIAVIRELIEGMWVRVGDLDVATFQCLTVLS